MRTYCWLNKTWDLCMMSITQTNTSHKPTQATTTKKKLFAIWVFGCAFMSSVQFFKSKFTSLLLIIYIYSSHSQESQIENR